MVEIWRRRRSTGVEDLMRNLRVLENELATGGRKSGAALNRGARRYRKYSNTAFGTR